jgi:16S rRNA (guanine966-N2)-methyltransferase
MTDQMKESLFSALGTMDGLRVLDLYAGSGSLGLEALSRGATATTFVESAHEAIVKLQANIEATGLGSRSEVQWSQVASTLARPADERMDLIFIDPPYGMVLADVRRDLEAVVMGGRLADAGRIALHRPLKESRIAPFGLQLVWERDYGQAHLYVFAHEDEEGSPEGQG